METAPLILGLIFGSIGLGYLIYGRRQSVPLAFVSGLALIALPYLVSGTLMLILAGLVAMAIPFLIRL